MIDVVAYMETWARWRANGCRRARIDPELGASIPAMTGKLLSGMGTSICPCCKGQGRAPGWRFHSHAEWIDPCPQCSGWGRTKSGDLGALRSSRTVDCPDCKDVFGVSRGEVAGRTCLKCRGSGKRVVVLFFQVNPASIRATRFSGANEDDDPVSMMIDRTVAGWKNFDETLWFHIVTVIEYAIGGTQERKAESAQRMYRRGTNHRGKLKMSRSWYAKNLTMAHTIIERKLHEMLDRESQNRI